MRYLAFLFAFFIATMASAQEGYEPARFRAGTVPDLPPLAVGGGQVILELTIGPDGSVTSLTPIRTSAPFAEMLADEAKSWSFFPAEDAIPRSGRPADRVAVESKVMVIGVYRPPVQIGPSLGEPPKDAGAPSGRSPFPASLTQPAFPPRAANPGVVLFEARVDRDGRVSETRVIRSVAPFDDAAREELEKWTFAPARVPAPGASNVYVVFGFPMPVGPAAQPKR